MTQYATINVAVELKEKLQRTSVGRETWTERIRRAFEAEQELQRLRRLEVPAQ